MEDQRTKQPGPVVVVSPGHLETLIARAVARGMSEARGRDGTGPAPGMLSTEQVAAELHCKPETVSRYCSDGRLQGRKIGRRWLISREALDAFKAVRR